MATKDKTILTIRDVDVLVQKKLVEVAKKKGYSSRDEMLRDILEKIAYEEYQMETEIRYKNLIGDQVKFLEEMQKQLLLQQKEFMYSLAQQFSDYEISKLERPPIFPE
ncbi:hypothetical protein [Enterococcus faecium]|uniref:Ribbon-helix-helix protein, CopG family n=1 Tax=Enterococcus faecium TaxID=1352 RepID=A0A9X3XWX9_ENTFC|nr:hypothetical protein [Enterococcus faecium]MDC4249040.1 hypothetical protein [Enterococcus faecium]